jgi:hypothetical protein
LPDWDATETGVGITPFAIALYFVHRSFYAMRISETKEVEK